MNEHELNLIAEYAAGSLPTDQVEAIEARIASNPTARTEYEAQLAALAALAAASPAQLNDLERSRMRQAVAEELHIVREVPEPERAARRRAVPWARLGTVAAVLAAVVIAAPLLNTLSIGGDASSDVADTFGEVTAEAPAVDSPSARLENAGSDDFGSGETLAATAPATIAEDSSQGVAAPPAAGDMSPEAPRDFGDLTAAALGELRTTLTSEPEDGLGFSGFLDDAELLERRLEEEPVDLPESCALDEDETVPGYETSVFVGFASIDDQPVLLFLVRVSQEKGDLLVAFDELTCEIRGVAGP